MKRFLSGLRYRFLNNFVNRIPYWIIRKFFYKVFGMRIGAKSRIGIKTIVISPNHIIIGHNTIINEFCHLDGRGKLEIGNNCSISSYTKIITGSHRANSIGFDYVVNPINIKNYVWIGTGAIILDNSDLEDSCIIGAGCVFKGRSQKRGIYIGNPAHKIKEREIDYIKDIDYRPFFK